MVLGVTGQLLLKSGINQKGLYPNVQSIVFAFLSPKILAGVSLYGVSLIIWLFILKRFPLSVAYPAMSLTYIAIVFLSSRFLGETITINKVIGSLLIIFGVYFLFK